MENNKEKQTEKGLFIVIEGPDGSGKTTQVELLADALARSGREYLITREPGGTAIGEQIREVILNPKNTGMSDVAEMLLYAAARAQLMKEVIVPALEAGKIVICDRFVDSSLVYQGIARGIGIETVRAVNAPGIGDYKPEPVFFLDLPEETGILRKKGQKELDRMEQESMDFHHMVAEGYRRILGDRDDVVRIDARMSVEDIHEIIMKCIRSRLNEGPDAGGGIL